jgi:hypothetical protein
MNIGPTQIAPAVAGNQTSENTRQPARSTPNPERSPRVEPSEIRNPKPVTPSADEVVKVHADTSTGSSILVYEFVDSRSGSLVFQIPSAQMLKLVQDIRQRLERMAASQRGGEEVSREGTNGNQP